eukprot:CAMPEP_0205915226 /NCGR_PEP_ID=MMETSP1325-20131115/7730_1 /ASSEMBLY_ACC=CAM_ASM_000708 /TAXON_ID=236786 /ORGANISM="Florenciella sp., Strain RCC1007" /LENGTH=45 /DNA_ID= /DNA_START= /DNA_END= /DNA_ORIENTATION=
MTKSIAPFRDMSSPIMVSSHPHLTLVYSTVIVLKLSTFPKSNMNA